MDLKDKEMKEEKEIQNKQDDQFYIIKKFSPIAKIVESQGLGQVLWDGTITAMMPVCEICQGGDGISHQCNYNGRVQLPQVTGMHANSGPRQGGNRGFLVEEGTLYEKLDGTLQEGRRRPMKEYCLLLNATIKCVTQNLSRIMRM